MEKMGSKWRKAKLALGLNTCLYVPRTLEDSTSSAETDGRLSDAVLPSPSKSRTPSRNSDSCPDETTTTRSSSSGMRLLRHSSKSLKICTICLAEMKPGQGQAIFTAECSHSFHFHCIASNVKHGSQTCPMCRANWKEVPCQSPLIGRARNPSWSAILQQLPPPRSDPNRYSSSSSFINAPDPNIFDDDDELHHQPEASYETPPVNREKLEVQTYTEVSAVSKSTAYSNFTVLIHLKAPLSSSINQCNSRAPLDLVTLLDTSGSMSGTKLALLKRAMGFLIQNLFPSDRLSVVAFSSTARRLFPLRRMTEEGKQEALQAVNSLTSNGGTNIPEGLQKGAKVIMDRKWKNPVSSIILLSDGHDTYTFNNNLPVSQTDYESLLPVSMHRNSHESLHIPVHTFGFGSDHDSTAMHSISELSGGTFSFIEQEFVIQDAFAQCIGGLLSVVLQELRVEVESIHPSLRLSSIKSGSYRSSLISEERAGFIEVGDLYAEEARDFLVTMDIPVDASSSNEMELIRVKCVYKDPISKQVLNLEEENGVKIQRPDLAESMVVSMEVDRQRNRLRAAVAMEEAKASAECGDLAAAFSILENCRNQLLETVSAQAGDRLCIGLGAELREMQERMSSRRVYESSGRAYVLSGLSSHLWQRATARGDSTDSTSLLQVYQTPTMVDMVSRSQTLIFGVPRAQSHPR